MDEILDRALNTAQPARASHGDARVVESRFQFIEVRNRRVGALQESAGTGLGVRAPVDGTWGLATAPEPGPAETERLARLACRLARPEAFGRDAGPTVFDYSGGCVVAPALKPRDFRFTGVSPS